MVHLRTVSDPWHARVLAARLGAEGIVTELRGNVSGPYPFGPAHVLVEAGQAGLAAQLLLADEVEAAFVPRGGTGEDGALPRRRSATRRLMAAAAAAAAVAVAGAPFLAHLVGQ